MLGRSGAAGPLRLRLVLFEGGPGRCSSVRVGGQWSGRSVLGQCLCQWLCQRVVPRGGWGVCPPVLVVVVEQWVVLLMDGSGLVLGSCIDGIVHFSAGIALLCTVPVKSCVLCCAGCGASVLVSLGFEADVLSAGGG